MIVTGWRTDVNVLNAIQTLHAHSNLSLKESRQAVDDILKGKPMVLPDDFVLREELEDLNFIIE